MLFKTNFEVLSETLGSQTTTGIWTAIDKEKKLVILDLEGTDSKQRGEDRLVTKNNLILDFSTDNLLVCTRYG